LCAALATIFLALNVAAETVVAQTTDQTYSVDGKDSFSIAGDIRSEISYSGTQTLRIRRHGKNSRYAAHVDYRRSDGPASTDATSDYVADRLPSGDIVPSSEHDPDYLTVLNQPFAAQLDRQTLGDLRRMSGSMPFDFPSPFTGSSLHGYLRHIGGGTLGARHATGVRFEAAGPMKGALPDRPGVTLNGTITMRGTAFYDSASAVLLALDSTVTINGTLSNRAANDPVTITYERKIRAREPQPTESARRAP